MVRISNEKCPDCGTGLLHDDKSGKYSCPGIDCDYTKQGRKFYAREEILFDLAKLKEEYSDKIKYYDEKIDGLKNLIGQLRKMGKSTETERTDFRIADATRQAYYQAMKDIEGLLMKTDNNDLG